MPRANHSTTAAGSIKDNSSKFDIGSDQSNVLI
jgi:hypothetical protein